MRSEALCSPPNERGEVLLDGVEMTGLSDKGGAIHFAVTSQVLGGKVALNRVHEALEVSGVAEAVGRLAKELLHEVLVVDVGGEVLHNDYLLFHHYFIIE